MFLTWVIIFSRAHAAFLHYPLMHMRTKLQLKIFVKEVIRTFQYWIHEKKKLGKFQYWVKNFRIKTCVHKEYNLEILSVLKLTLIEVSYVKSLSAADSNDKIWVLTSRPLHK